MCALSLSELSVEELQRLGLHAPCGAAGEDPLDREAVATAADGVSAATGNSP